MTESAVEVCLVSDPDLAAEIATRLAEELPYLLTERVADDVEWQVNQFIVPFHGEEQLTATALGELAENLNTETCDVTILITDLPRRAGLRPIAAEVSLGDRVALVSLPALGPFRVYARAREAVLRLIGELMRGDYLTEPPPGARLGLRRRKHARLPSVTIESLAQDPEAPEGVRLVGSPLLGVLRLVGGMVRANQPWRLFLGLSRSLAGVFATAAFAILTRDAWEIGAELSPIRQAILAAAAVTLLIAWLIIDHDLWERGRGPVSSRLAMLYNLTTVLTLAAGVLSLYVEVFIGIFAVEQLLLTPHILIRALGILPTWLSNLGIVTFATSAATIGGALGSGFEDDTVVRRATYGARQRERHARAHRRDLADGAASDGIS